MPKYLVERYVPNSAGGDLEVVTGRDRDGAALMSADGAPVRWLFSTLVPADEICFCVFESPSEDAVREANERTENRYERISEAVTAGGTDADGEAR